MRKTRFLQWAILSIVFLSLLGIAQERLTLSGWFHIRWYDGPIGSGIRGEEYWLDDDQGQSYRLLIDRALFKSFNGPLALNRQRVQVVTARATPSPDPSAIQVLSIQIGKSENAPAHLAPQAHLTGSHPWVNILCRFADSTEVTPQPLSYFSGLMANTYPGLDHYWREQSYNTTNIAGSQSLDWQNLPQPRSYYVSDKNGDGDTNDAGEADLNKLFTDCTAIHDPSVNFPTFVGINMMFNGLLDCCAWGGSRTATLDGVTKTYRVTWEPTWGYGNQSVMGHEMGHGWGFPHSSGPYTATYDSDWDVMSGGGICSPPHATYGCVGVHTITHHKGNIAHWVPTAQLFVPTLGSTTTITLERLSQPTSSTNYLMARIPIGGSSTQFYTVEARNSVGYDTQIPGAGVIIHNVNTSLNDRDAQVVDGTNDTNPNDAGARWLPGETFTDAANNITIAINSSTATSYNVTITRGIVDPPANDNFANAQIISGNTGTTTGTNGAATKESGEPNHAGNAGGASVWYRWTAPLGGSVTIDTIGSNFDTLLGVYTGSSVNSLTQIASNDDSGSTLQSSVTFIAVSGTTYQIAVDGYGGVIGNITLHWNLPNPSTPALARLERDTGNFFTDGAYYCGLGTPGPVTPPAAPCFNAGSGADLAEHIDVSESVQPGDVVEPDPEHPKHYRKARGNSSVSGVISTQPGITLNNTRQRPIPSQSTTALIATIGIPSLTVEESPLALSWSLQTLIDVGRLFEIGHLRVSQLYQLVLRQDMRPLLALMGRVPVKATTENGPIQPGDLLVVSASRPGYATKCKDPKACEGSVVGKALENLEQGEGLIFVLVTSR
jgi:M6 family metalloprotease-like protein